MGGIIWIIGRNVKMATNGHEYLAEPFIAFATEDEAEAACDLVQKVSGERPGKRSVELMSVGSAAPKVATR